MSASPLLASSARPMAAQRRTTRPTTSGRSVRQAEEKLVALRPSADSSGRLQVIDVNCTGVFLTMQACAKVMVEKKCKGSLIAFVLSPRLASMPSSDTDGDTFRSVASRPCRARSRTVACSKLVRFSISLQSLPAILLMRDLYLAYNTSKSAVLQMCRSMACELGQYGIRCNSMFVLRRFIALCRL